MKALKVIRKISLLVSLATVPALLPQAVLAALQCYHCHGTTRSGDIRPVDASFRNISSGGFVGSHRNHAPPGATVASCAKCHPGSQDYSSSHRDGMIRVSPNINFSRQVTTYNNRTSAWPQTPVPVQGEQANMCTNVNCHFEKDTPSWGSPASLTGCSSCHISPPDDDRHN